MPIIYQLPTAQPSMVGVYPNFKFAVFGDNLATITTAGYLNQVNLESNPISTTDVLQVLYSFNPQTQSGTYDIFTVSISSSGVITLVSDTSAGNVLLPVVANNIAQFNGTTGQIYDGSATAAHAGNIQAGVSGTAGTFISFPATAANGTLILAAANAGGAFNTTIRNGTMAQSTVYTIPDVTAATGQLLAKTAAFVSGNLIQASGTAGVTIDSGVATTALMKNNAVNTMTGVGQIILVKANGVEAANAVTASGNAGVITTSALTTAAGGTYSITWTNTKITATSVIGLTIQGGTNTVQSVVFTCVPGAGTATLVINNIGPTNALNGTILIGYTVF